MEKRQVATCKYILFVDGKPAVKTEQDSFPLPKKVTGHSQPICREDVQCLVNIKFGNGKNFPLAVTSIASCAPVQGSCGSKSSSYCGRCKIILPLKGHTMMKLVKNSAWVLGLVFATSSAQAAVAPVIIVKGTVVAFNETSVRLLVDKVPVVVPRDSIPNTEELRADTQVQAILPWDGVKPDNLGMAVQKKHARH
jgi:hypothetical protein